MTRSRAVFCGSKGEVDGKLPVILVIHAKLAMCFAWTVSFVLWAPWIIGWQFIVSERTVPANDCYIQFIQVRFLKLKTSISGHRL